MKVSKSHRVESELRPGQSVDQALAEMMADGIGMNARTAVAFSKTLGELDLTAAIAAIGREIRRVQGGDLGGLEAILTAQAIALNAMFTSLAFVTTRMSDVDQIDRFTRLGLKAQGQCRATLETLAVIKSPPAVFARQANFSNGPQQVNNGLQPTAAALPARAGDSESAPIKLLEANGQRLDYEEARRAVDGDKALAALGTLNRTTDGPRKGSRLAKR